MPIAQTIIPIFLLIYYVFFPALPLWLLLMGL
jgi:hypothetical protein